MDSCSLDVNVLSSKIQDLACKDFHTLINPTNVDIDSTMDPALLGKIVAIRSFSTSIVQASLKATWSLVREFSLAEIDPNIFHFQFLKVEDKDFILKNTPWNIQGHLIVLIHWEPDLTIAEMELHLSIYGCKYIVCHRIV